MNHLRTSGPRVLALVGVFCASFLPTAASAQDIDFGIDCGGAIQDDFRAIANTMDPVWLTDVYAPSFLSGMNLDSTWTHLLFGGPGNFDPARGLAVDKFVVAGLLMMHGLDTQPLAVAVNQSGDWDYDPSVWYLTRNHNLLTEYAQLANSVEINACVELNKSTGAPRCGPYCTRSFLATICSAPTYGRRNTLSLAEDDGSGSYAVNNGQGGITYLCPAFVDPFGTAQIASIAIHEKFHSVSHVGHEDCQFGAGRCAKEWDFDLPRFPSSHNELATHKSADAYQIGYRHGCDMVEAPAEWMPLMAWIVQNEFANFMADQRRYMNIVDTSSPPINSGVAPYKCGLPDSILKLVVGDACPDGGTRCDTDVDCGVGEECVGLCCQLEEIIR